MCHLFRSDCEGDIRKGSFYPKTKFTLLGSFFGFDGSLFVCLGLVEVFYLCVGM